MSQVVHLARIIGVNGVAVWGVLHGWSPVTILIVYWFETFLGSLLVAARIELHRRTTMKRGHFLVETHSGGRKSYEEGSFLKHFLLIAVLFTTAHGVFLAVFLGILLQNGVVRTTEGADVVANALMVTALLLVTAFIADLPGIGGRSFAWIRAMRNQALGRTFLLQMTIVVGILVAAMTGRSVLFFALFIGGKLLFEAASTLRWHRADGAPPAWLTEAMRKEGEGKELESWERYWVERWRVDSAAMAESELRVAPTPGREGYL